MSKEMNSEAQIKSAKELKIFLTNIKNKLDDNSVSPIYAMTGLNSVLTMSNIYDLLDTNNKELAREIWLRLKKSGFQLNNPPMLFDVE